jgi:beta-glucuronidase
MVKYLLLAYFSFFFYSPVIPAQIALQNASAQVSKSLNGKWHYIIDPLETGYYDYRYQPRDQQENPGQDAFFTNAKAKDKTSRIEYDFDAAPTINVPGDWNTQDEKLFYYEGTIWYKRSFDYKKVNTQNRIFLHFGAANFRADVYLNGEKLGYHAGGFTPFAFEITALIKTEDNFVIVKVDNKRDKDAVPTSNFDWWNYGGITRDVSIIESPPTFIQDYRIQLNPDNPNSIEGYVQLDGASMGQQSLRLDIPELNIRKSIQTDATGRAKFKIGVEDINYWSPDNPKLYNIQLFYGPDVLEDQIGFRTIRTKGQDVLLNGESVFLRGICIHEENPLRGGRAHSKEDARLLLTWAKELGCNFVRLAHYPHSENMIRIADEMGIMVWEELPVYWTISFDNPDTYAAAERQLEETIFRDKNRASVVIWSMANETPQSADRFNFLKQLAQKARSLDDSRLISAALEIHQVEGKPNTISIDDPFEAYVDILSFNQYVGWYSGLPDRCLDIVFDIKQNKPVLISEFGGGALFGYEGDRLTRWSEAYQEDLYRKSLTMLQQIPQLRGLSPWLLVDFRSPKRLLPNVQDGWNRKGLIAETGDKKKAFFVMRAFYETIKSKW